VGCLKACKVYTTLASGITHEKPVDILSISSIALNIPDYSSKTPVQSTQSER